MPKVACIGEAMVELSLAPADPTSARVGFAGDTLNTAIYLKRAAPELEVHYVTRLGIDTFSDRMVSFIAAEGLATDFIGRSTTRMPGLYAISTDAEGERSFSYWRDRSAARELFCGEPPGLSDLSGFDVLYFSGITLAILTPEARRAFLDFLAGFRLGGGRVAFDSNYRPKLWPDSQTARTTVSAAWALTDTALPSLDDEMALFQDADQAKVLSRLQGLGVRAGALKRGSQGPISLSGEAGDLEFPAAKNVIDTTAAGDSFNAGYLAALLTGGSEAAALRAGHDRAVEVIGVKGAIIPRRAGW